MANSEEDTLILKTAEDMLSILSASGLSNSSSLLSIAALIGAKLESEQTGPRDFKILLLGMNPVAQSVFDQCRAQRPTTSQAIN
jgi:hypothetical protein